jgi:hypothetical protein
MHGKAQRRDELGFWVEYLTAARAGFGLPFDEADQMRVAINEWFRKIDQAVREANASGCTYFRCRQSYENCETLTLLFSNGKDRTFRRTPKIDDRFQRHGNPLSRGETIDLKIALQSMILNEGKVRAAPKGGWIGPA